ncbi:MAG: TOMM precursor leader peptide-binding protein [Pseudonocardia sp.]|nr:TOMM precursor leader peptide-binding protein [Pseudonocardia sp.]
MTDLAVLDTTMVGTHIGLLGSGLLHSAVANALGSRCRVDEGWDALAGCAVLVVASDANDTRTYPAAYQWAAERRTPWLPVRVETGWVLIGPAVLPPEPGCPACLQRRRAGNRSDGKARGLLRRQFGAELASEPSPLVTPLLANMVATLIIDELDRLLDDRSTARTRGGLLCVSLRSGALARHSVLAHPSCPRCSTVPDDDRKAAVIRLRRLPKSDPARWRVGALESRPGELERLFVDAETGVIASLGSGADSGGATAVARLDPSMAEHDSQHGYGHAEDFRSATLAAIAEALERLAGTYPRGRRTMVRAPYAEVAEHSLDPRTLGLYPGSWYDQPDFRFTRFHPDRETTWVWGYSFARAEPLLIPRTFAYYGAGPPDDPGFAYECSNGCALGGCLEEAILYGLLEVAERDAFLMTWYTRMPVTKVDLSSACDCRIPLVVELIRQRLGYEPMAFDTTVEQGVPAFWVMGVDLSDDQHRPKVVCGAGAHPDPEHALRGALRELASGLSNLRHRYDRDVAAGMLADPALVREMDDHAMLYGHPDAYQRLDFLMPSQLARPLPDFAERWSWPGYDDLSDDLAELVGRYLASGLDVIAVDTTSPEHRVGGFACAKVIVPGTLSMTFGHRYRRIHGLPRLTTVPRRLGKHVAADLNPFPHPFP